MFAIRYWSVVILLAAAAVGFFVWHTTGHGGRFDFKLGLDLSGGSHLVYNADTSKIAAADVPDSLASLREVVERRVNAFGVGEPLVQTEQGGALGNGGYRLIVELPGITDVNEAVKIIGETPVLEFKLVNQGQERPRCTTPARRPTRASLSDTGLTGKYLSRASLQFGNGQGHLAAARLSASTLTPTAPNSLAISPPKTSAASWRYSSTASCSRRPTVSKQAITDGTAIISAILPPQSAKEMVRNLNLGALPVPITLASTETIGATLGDEALHAGLVAGIAGFVLLSLFMVLWYRLPGVVAVVSLFIYVLLMLLAL
jgi:preprotein translocase subunit SecD